MRRWLACTGVLALLACGSVRAAQKPLWEAGLGIGAISFPDYTGSDQQRGYIVPVPYFVYRGKILKANRDGVQATLFGSTRLRAYISLSASPPISSRDDTVRDAMPDVHATLGVGPALDVRLWHWTHAHARLQLLLPLQVVYGIALPLRQVGWYSNPVLNLDFRDVVAQYGWNLGLQAGPIFTDRRYAQTYYGVAPAYATATRPAYAAPGGYGGSQFTGALSRRFQRFWIGAFMRYYDLDGAGYASSPLVTARHNIAAGIGIAWMLGQSTREVESRD